MYDIDFSYTAYRAGLRLGVANDLNVLHRSWGRYDGTWSVYAERFNNKWKPLLTVAPAKREYRWAYVDVRSTEEALEVMTPSYWPMEPSGSGNAETTSMSV